MKNQALLRVLLIANGAINIVNSLIIAPAAYEWNDLSSSFKRFFGIFFVQHIGDFSLLENVAEFLWVVLNYLSIAGLVIGVLNVGASKQDQSASSYGAGWGGPFIGQPGGAQSSSPYYPASPPPPPPPAPPSPTA